MDKFVVGLTGGIGSGKTTVANLFAKLGVDIVDADIVARNVVKPNSEALTQIQQHFGQDYILPDGNLDRSKLRQQVFSQPQAKEWLNSLLHPLIREKIVVDIDTTTSPYCILVAPLLLENSLDSYVNKVLVVDVTVSEQMIRTLKRDNGNEQQIQAIIDSQIDRDSRLLKADNIINNSGDSTSDNMHDNQQLLVENVRQLHERYLEISQLK